MPLALATWLLIGLVLVIVVVLLVVKVTRGSATTAAPAVADAPAAVVGTVAQISPATFDAVGAPGPPVVVPPVPATAVSGLARPEGGGRAVVVYVGGEFCPYCAVERWALVVGLSRFGTFTHLGETSSSRDEVFGGTATFSFDGARFESRYLTLDAVELYGALPSTGASAGFPRTATPDADEQAVLRVAGPVLPVVDLGGVAVQAGAGVPFSPAALRGLSLGAIAGDLDDPATPVAQMVLGAANEVAAAVCRADGGRPGAVCDSAGVRAGAARLGLG